jgi:hypothetical protein
VFIASPPRAERVGRGSILRLHCNISWAAETSPQDSAREKRQMAQHLPLLGSWVTSSTVSRAASYTPLLHETATVTVIHICDLTYRSDCKHNDWSVSVGSQN